MSGARFLGIVPGLLGWKHIRRMGSGSAMPLFEWLCAQFHRRDGKVWGWRPITYRQIENAWPDNDPPPRWWLKRNMVRLRREKYIVVACQRGGRAEGKYGRGSVMFIQILNPKKHSTQQMHLGGKGWLQGQGETPAAKKQKNTGGQRGKSFDSRRSDEAIQRVLGGAGRMAQDMGKNVPAHAD